MIKKAVFGIVKQENLLKNIFTGLGYFVFVAIIGKVFVAQAPESGLLSTIFSTIGFLVLFALAVCFWLVHVIRPIMQITWPNFGIPNIDRGVKKIPYYLMIKRLDIWIFLITAYASINFGVNFMEVLIQNTR